MTGARPSVARINVLSTVRDPDLDAIRGVLGRGYFEAGTRDAVHALLAALADAGLEVAQVDLIGHSDGDGLLRLGGVTGGWTLDPTEVDYVAAELAPLLARLGTRRLCLLGCSTAASEAAREVLGKLAAALDGGDRPIEVVGTRRLIDSSDYGPSGFAAIDALWPEQVAPGARAVS